MCLVTKGQAFFVKSWEQDILGYSEYAEPKNECYQAEFWSSGCQNWKTNGYALFAKTTIFSMQILWYEVKTSLPRLYFPILVYALVYYVCTITLHDITCRKFHLYEDKYHSITMQIGYTTSVISETCKTLKDFEW